MNLNINKINTLILILSATLASGSVTYAKKPVLKAELNSVNVTRLSLHRATELAKAAINACRKKGIQVGVTVVDRNGIVQVTLRDTLAAPLTLKISALKAYTAANFAVNTSQLKRQANSPLAQVNGLMMSPGGVAVKVGGKLLAAIGVSGAPSGITDETCAVAGVKKLIRELELDI